MPVNEVHRGGKLVGYKMGNTGKLYTIEEYGKELAKYKAMQQLRAVQVNKKMK